MNSFKIYLCGVGGQGIGLLNELLIRACSYVIKDIKGVDTHGLAQRGGMVESYLKLGKGNYSPLIAKGDADMVIALEIHEAMRAMNCYLKDGGTLVYYPVSLQPLEVRLYNKGRVTEEMIDNEAKRRNIRSFSVTAGEIEDRKFQNIALFASLCKNKLIPEILEEHYANAIRETIMPALYDSVSACFSRFSK